MSNGGLISGAFSSGDGGFNLSQKGQIHTYSTTQAALSVGANDTILTADSTETTGIKWGAASAGGIWTAAGNDVQTSGVSELSVSGFTGRDITEIIAYIHSDQSLDTKPRVRVNGISSSTYYLSKITNTSYSSATGLSGWELTNNTAPDMVYLFHMLISQPNSNFENTGVQILYHLNANVGAGGSPPDPSFTQVAGIGGQEQTADITELSVDFTVGDIVGSMQVNNMDYQ